MKKKGVRILGFVLFILGLFFLLDSKTNITGAVIGTSNISSTFSSILGIALVLVSIILSVSGKSLEERLGDEHHWKLYKISLIRQAEDVERGYLKRKKQENKLTPIQERIERSVNIGNLIKKPYQEHTYEEQFHSGHASQGGRIIDVDSHIIHKGKYTGRFFDKIKRLWKKGKLEHFNKPADGWYIWVADEEGKFIIGERETFESVRHGYKLPHPVLAEGKRVYGAGEVLIQNGLVQEYNTASGHYFDLDNPQGFNKQGREVFNHFRKKAGWKEVSGGAKYTTKHEVDKDSINY